MFQNMLEEHSFFQSENLPELAELDSSTSIHSERSVQFYREILKADSWVLETLENHYKIPFFKTPTPYYEKNNQSAIQNKKFLWKKICEWEEKGFCLKVSHKPFCCNPMTVSEKRNSQTGEIKLRPCMDFSRHVNKYITDQPVRLSNLAEAEKLLEPGDFQTSYDMENQYFQVKLNKDYWKYLGCEIETPEGTTNYYVFTVMIYGLKSAVFTVTKLIKPIIRHLMLKGIRNSIFIDDGRILGST